MTYRPEGGGSIHGFLGLVLEGSGRPCRVFCDGFGGFQQVVCTREAWGVVRADVAGGVLRGLVVGAG